MRTFKWLALAMVVLLMSACASAQEMSAAGKSAQDAFQDSKVVSLLQAVRDSNLSKAKLLVAQGANVNASGSEGVTPLIWMLYQHDDRAMEMLLDLGANPNQSMGKDGGTPVWFAAGGGHLRALKILLAHNGNPNSMGDDEPALMIAIEDSHMDCADYLLIKGADINWHKNFNSVIMAPMVHNRLDLVIWVLDHGYTYDLIGARRMIAKTGVSKNQEIWRARALDAIDRRISELKNDGH